MFFSSMEKCLLDLCVHLLKCDDYGSDFSLQTVDKTAKHNNLCMFSLCFQNQNKSPLDHSISIHRHTQIQFIPFFHSVCRVCHSHMNETKRVRAYMPTYRFECDVISLFTVWYYAVLCILADNSNVGDDSINAICVSILSLCV